MAGFLKSVGASAKSLLRQASEPPQAPAAGDEKQRYVAQLWDTYQNTDSADIKPQVFGSMLPLAAQHCASAAAFSFVFGDGRGFCQVSLGGPALLCRAGKGGRGVAAVAAAAVQGGAGMCR